MHLFGSNPRPGLIRLKAAFLLAVFLAAGTSLPSLDALAYHGESEGSERSRTHVEPAGGCLSHADHCALGRTATGSGAGLPLTGTARIAAASQPASPLLPVYPLTSTDRRGNPQSRAPPAPQV